MPCALDIFEFSCVYQPYHSCFVPQKCLTAWKGPCNTFDECGLSFLRAWKHGESCSNRQHRVALCDLLGAVDASSSFCIAMVEVLFEVAVECGYCCNWRKPASSHNNVWMTSLKCANYAQAEKGRKSSERVSGVSDRRRLVILGWGALGPPIVSTGCARQRCSESISDIEKECHGCRVP